MIDPACGSGNFLTESYLCLRRLENEALKLMVAADSKTMTGQIAFGFDEESPIHVSIHQFYGIEINDFAAAVAKTALWIAESQMLRETEDIIHQEMDFFPLKDYAGITEGNALRLDWRKAAPVDRLSYIIGNPPFVGYSLQTKEQKADILSLYVDEKGKPYKTAGKIDYVSGWYWKASELMTRHAGVRAALVSTNSISQGEQVAAIWKPLYDRFGIHIDFAYRTFVWDSEADQKAQVHCVIVSFSRTWAGKKHIYIDGAAIEAKTISPYLIDAPDVFIQSRKAPLCAAPEMTTGNRPADGGHLIIEKEDYEEFIKHDPAAKPYIKKLVGSAEFINGKDRYCLWLVGVSPSELRKMPEVLKRIEACREDRLNGADDRKKLADTPALFRETKNPDSFVIIPATSSERRRYVPMGFLDSGTIATNAAIIIPEAQIYHFGVLTSNVHMAWMRTICGRLKSDYRYSKDIVYNNFPWPNPTAAQRQQIEQTAQAILDARALYPDSSLASLYDPLTMPIELRRAHQMNDKAVMQAYGMPIRTTDEAACVAWLMRLYQEITQGNK